MNYNDGHREPMSYRHNGIRSYLDQNHQHFEVLNNEFNQKMLRQLIHQTSVDVNLIIARYAGEIVIVQAIALIRNHMDVINADNPIIEYVPVI